MVLSDTKEQSRVLVVGEEAAKGLATHLAEDWDVRLLSNDESIIGNVATNQFESDVVEYEAGVLQDHVDDEDTAVVVTERDQVGLLVVQSLNACCNVDQIFVRVDDPQNRHAFEDLDCEILETGAVLRPEVEQALERGAD